MKKKKLNRSWIGNIFLFLVIVIFGAFTALPFVYAISNAFKPLDQMYLFPPPLFVTNPTTEHFVQLSQLANDFWVPLSRYLFNSVLVSLLTTVGHVILSSMAAYPMARHNFIGKKFINKMIVLSLLFTSTVTAIPTYIVMAEIKILDTAMALIFPMLISSLGLYLMQNFMLQIPESILESARIDGANEFRIFWSIVMPNCRPAWLTLLVLIFKDSWNRDGNLYIYTEELKVFPSIMSSIASGNSSIARAGVVAAASLLVMLPPMIIFVLTQHSIVETMSSSGMKE